MAEELWDTLRLRGLTHFAPTFVTCRVLAVQEIPLRADLLLGAGVPSWAIELAARGPEANQVRPASAGAPDAIGRPDLPKAPSLRRASMQAALEAARPEHRAGALAALDQDVLASTTVASNQSRVRFYEAVCRAWSVEPWPLSRSSVRAFGASLKAGGYRSVAVYFSAITGHQLRTMWQPPSPEVKQCMQDTKRAVLRGAGPSRLKDFFHVPDLVAVLEGHEDIVGFEATRPRHMAETLLLSSWWMLREIEAANAQVGHVSWNDSRGEVTLMLPVQKCDTQGLLCCRTLRCACRISRQTLCPYHSMKRHMARLAARGPTALSPRAPLFPGPGGGVMTKDQFVSATRAALQACGVTTTREYEGVQLERFTGHIARISGAQWLHNIGIPMQMLQVLGRWASLTIMRYLQSAPLQVLPATAATALVQGPVAARTEGPWVLVSPPETQGQPDSIVDVDDSDVDRAGPSSHRAKRRRRQQREPSPPVPGVESHGETPEDPASRAEVLVLREEVGALQSALEQLQSPVSYIVQGRSRRHHRIAIPEAANHPASWATVCGWKYGLSQFYRANTIGSNDRKCCRCFQTEQDGREESSQSQSGSERGSDDSSSSSSSDSS